MRKTGRAALCADVSELATGPIWFMIHVGNGIASLVDVSLT